ncbi:MAG: hypothetical protein ACXWNK_09330 [Vulcanimicrobiaceae bacterium]
MGWSRTLRVDEMLDDEQRISVAAALRGAGASVRFGPPNAFARTYALVEAGDEIVPETVERCTAHGRLYDEAIIAVAIEPMPADALLALEDALGGGGRPAGITACDRAGSALIVELRPTVMPFALLAASIEVELRRFGGYRTTQLLSPLPVEVTAAIAADGLQAAEIAPDRILETLLARADAQ